MRGRDMMEVVLSALKIGSLLTVEKMKSYFGTLKNLHTCMRLHRKKNMFVHIPAYIIINVVARTHSLIHIHAYVLHTYTQTLYVHIYTHIRIYVPICKYLCACMHAYTHILVPRTITAPLLSAGFSEAFITKSEVADARPINIKN